MILEPNVVGSIVILYKSNHFRNYWHLIFQQRRTNIEKWKMKLQLLAEKQVERWILICFDRGKKDVKRAVSPRQYLHNLIMLFHEF